MPELTDHAEKKKKRKEKKEGRRFLLIICRTVSFCFVLFVCFDKSLPSLSAAYVWQLRTFSHAVGVCHDGFLSLILVIDDLLR